MCGRFSLTTPEKELTERFSALGPPSGMKPRYNCAPTQKLAVITSSNPARIELLKWGMGESNMINARLESLKSSSSSFHSKTKPCLVLADGFYEWKQSGSHKVPFRVTLPNEDPFAFAGLFAEDSFCIITCNSTERMQKLHDRMPVILERHQENRWLKLPVSEGLRLLGPLERDLQIYPVSPLVNSVGVDSPAVIKSITTLGDF